MLLTRHLAFLTLLLLATVPGTLAGQATGTIAGTVLDSTSSLAVTGAIVRIPALGREVVTDRSGRFRLAGIPAGGHDLTTVYIGYQAARMTVTVRSGQTTDITLQLVPAVTDLGTLVVEASRTGQAAALNQQRVASNVTNVVAADQIGRFPDANIGDAVKRLPGVTVALDQGEARFASIRGTEPRFNSVLLNGERIPSAEAEVREIQMDLVPADMVQAIELSKTLTPDMDADAIGGALNVVTRVAPVGFRLSTTLGSGYNFIRDEPVLLGSAVLGTRFFDDRLGVILSGSYYDQRYGSDNKEGTWNQTDDGAAYMDEFDVRRYDIQRIRRSLSGSLDWRLSSGSTLFLRGIYNHRDDWENRFRTRYVFEEPDAAGRQTAEIRRQTKGGGPEGSLKQARLEDQRVYSFQLSGEHLLGSRSVFTWAGALSRASETRPDERYIEWRNRNVVLTPDYSDEQTPTFTPVDPSAVSEDRFTFRRIEQQESFTRDLDRTARADLLLPFNEGNRLTQLKFGARYRGKEKNRDNTFARAVPLTPADYARLTSLEFRDYTVDENLAGPYAYGSYTTPAQLAALSLFDPAEFELEDQPGEYAAGNFDASERISAGYVQVERQLGASLSAIAGVRVEHTSIDYNGFEYDVDTDEVTPTSGGQSYTDVLPGVTLRWEAARNTVVRAAWTNTLARPNYFDLVPYREVSLEDDELATGNPDLKPTRSMNWDLSVERYFESVGLVSFGVFHKNISDFIFNFTEFQAVDPVTGKAFSQISRPLNGAEARLTGFEAGFQRQLDFLPGFLRYLGFYGNYTFNDSQVEGLDIEGRDLEDLPLLGTAKHSANGSLSFDSPRVSLRFAVNYQSESLDAGEGGYNEEAFFDRWADRRTDMDANASVLVTRQLRVFAEANNLGNRPLRYYQGVQGRLMQDEFYGRRVQVGVKYDF